MCVPADLGFYTLRLGVLGNLQISLSIISLNCKPALFRCDFETSRRCEVTVKGQSSLEKCVSIPLCGRTCTEEAVGKKSLGCRGHKRESRIQVLRNGVWMQPHSSAQLWQRLSLLRSLPPEVSPSCRSSCHHDKCPSLVSFLVVKFNVLVTVLLPRRGTVTKATYKGSLLSLQLQRVSP